MKSVKKILFLPLLMLILFITSCEITGGTQNPPATEYEYKTPETDKLKLTTSYQGKEFIKDGIGEVSVVRYVDGDTSMFKTSTGEIFTTRYLGINTPESTYRIEPWGFSASKQYMTELWSLAQKIESFHFQKHPSSLGEMYEILKDQDAKMLDFIKIVLQADTAEERTDSNGRYLAWVWLISKDGDSRLLNLELAELAYAQVKCETNALYYQSLLAAIQPLVLAKVRIYGEKDPAYDYNKEGVQMSIKEVREKYGTPEQIEAYSKGGETTSTTGELIVSGAGTLVVISGTVVRKNGNTNAYIQQYDEETNKYYGIYVYGGYNTINKLLLGANVEITAKIGYHYGSLQLTDLTSDKRIKLYNVNNEIVYEDMLPEDVDDINNYSQIGRLVRVSNLKVTGYKDADNTNAFSIYTSYVDSNGKTQKLDIRVDSGIILRDPDGKQIKSGAYFPNKTIDSLIAIIGYYNWESSNITYSEGRIQLMLTDMADIVFSE